MVVGQHGPRGLHVVSRVEKARGFVPARAQILSHKMAANHVTTHRQILRMDHVTCLVVQLQVINFSGALKIDPVCFVCNIIFLNISLISIDFTNFISLLKSSISTSTPTTTLSWV